MTSLITRFEIAALLPELLAQSVRAAIVPPGSLQALRSPDELIDHVHRHWCEAAIVDPELLIIARRLGDAIPPGTAIVAFTRLTPTAIRNALILVRVRPWATRVVFQGQYRGNAWLRAELACSIQGRDSAVLGERVSSLLNHAPAPITDGIRIFCERVHPLDTVRTLAICCATSPVSLARWLARDQVKRPTSIVIGAQLVRAFRLLACAEISTDRIANILSLASPQTLERRLRRIVGWERADLIGQRDSQEMIDRVIARLGMS